MKKLLLTSVKLHLKMMLTTSFLVVGLHQANAQGLTFGTMYKGDPKDGWLITGVAGQPDRVLNIGVGTGDTYVKPNAVIPPSFLDVDASGNFAVGFNNGNRIIRINKATGTAVQFQSVGLTYQSLKIDPSGEHIYWGGLLGATPAIYRSTWSSNGANTSAGFYDGQAPGTLTNTNVRAIPFLTTGDRVFLNGSATATAYTFGTIRGLTFDAAGNIYFADITNPRIAKATIAKKATAVSNSVGSSLTLPNVSGLVAGQLVSGMFIPASTYIGAVNSGNNTITLVKADNSPQATIAIIPTGTAIAFVTGVSHIAGTGTAATATLPAAAAGTTPLNFVNTNITVGMTFDAAGNLYVTDHGASRIVKIVATAGAISASSAVEAFATGLSNSMGNIAFGLGGRLYITQRATGIISRVADVGATAVETVAGSLGRLSFTNYTTSTASTTVTVAAGTDLSKMTEGMTIRGANFQVGTKIVSKGTNAFVVDVAPIASGLVNTATSTSSGGATLTSADGFVTNGTGTTLTGQFDSPNGLIIHNNMVYVAESTGAYVRELTSLTTLPVTLAKEFAAKLNGSAVNLSWATSSERNNNRFVVKRSTDGVNYKEINSQPAKGDAGATYATIDFNPVNGTNYYELSQIDNDGKSKVLGVQVVKVAWKEAALTIYPNPVPQGASFSVRTAVDTKDVVVKVADLSGRLIYNQTFNKNASGVYTVQLQATKGIYIVSINEGNAQKITIK